MSIELSELPKTALFSFWARVADAQSSSSILNDKYAVSIAPCIENAVGKIEVPPAIAAGSCMRAKTFDEFLRRSLEMFPQSTVVEIGPGLDSRYERLGHKVSQWIDVDYPEIISLRRKFMSAGTGERVYSESTSTDPTPWIEKIAKSDSVIVIAQGVLQYWRHEEVKRLFSAAALSAPYVHILFDSMAPPLVHVNNKKNKTIRLCPDYKWSVWNTSRIGDGEDFRVDVIDEKNFMDMDKSVKEHMPFKDRIIYGAPVIRNFYRMTFAQVCPA